MTTQEKDRIECAIRHIQTAVDIDPWAVEIAVEAMEKEIYALQAQDSPKPTAESAQNVQNEDLISRKAAIDAIVDCTVYGNADELEEAVMQGNDWNRWSGGVLEALEAVKDLPSAQPEPLVKESRTLVKDLVKDTISRQATIDALVKAIRKDPYYDTIMRAERRTDDL